jgi:alanyl-tRNA synthetase
MITLEQIRSEFLNFFEGKGCKIVKSSGLVPNNDPTLLFTNSGMVQFKNYFNGTEKAKYTRIATAQKCVRAGGKHNDLDNVGYTARHHTFFEMLGNFSFGDYFKREAITWAWEFLTSILKIPKDKLLATIYCDDEEAYSIWNRDVGLPPERIIRLKENFWEMGDTGPCGPCSEIFYDHGAEILGGVPGSPEEDGDRYIEIWNLVFTQFNRNEKGELEELPKKNIDTGMGLERIAAVLQGVHNNYDTDIFTKLINNSKSIIGDGDIFCHRIIADHLRSSCFLIADGVLPSNEGRGYVLRRIMRRAMLQIHKLGCEKTTMYKLVPFFVNQMGNVYGELKDNEELIMETLKIEEDRFRETLGKGIKILEDKIENLQNSAMLNGADAFEMYDTYGFPLDLTTIILKDKNISVDYDGFEVEMAKQRERARANWVGSGDTKNNELLLQINEPTIFEGYDNYSTKGAKILNIIKNNSFVEKATKGDEVEIILDKTCFYGESGGQVGDTGLMILLSDNYSIRLPFSTFKIQNTLKGHNIIVHRGIIEDGEFEVGNLVNLSISNKRRKQITANHSAAHLLQYALRNIVGNTVTQKGSHVDENRLRFDITCNRQISREDIQKVEQIVNEIILQNSEVKTEIMSLEKAKDLGAMALFSEKYGDSVRVVFMGKNIGDAKYQAVESKNSYDVTDVIKSLTKSSNGDNNYLSIELCGGCHVKQTGDIGFFKIVKEESIAAGVRRIEAITGLKTLEYVNNNENLLFEINKILKSDNSKLLEKINVLLKENKDLAKKNTELEKKTLKNFSFNESEIDSILLVTNELDNVNAGLYREVVIELLRTKYKENTVIISQCKNDGKIVAIVGVSENLKNKYKAIEVLKKLDGNGGGSDTLAVGQINCVILGDKIKKLLKF